MCVIQHITAHIIKVIHATLLYQLCIELAAMWYALILILCYMSTLHGHSLCVCITVIVMLPDLNQPKYDCINNLKLWIYSHTLPHPFLHVKYICVIDFVAPSVSSKEHCPVVVNLGEWKASQRRWLLSSSRLIGPCVCKSNEMSQLSPKYTNFQTLECIVDM